MRAVVVAAAGLGVVTGNGGIFSAVGAGVSARAWLPRTRNTRFAGAAFIRTTSTYRRLTSSSPTTSTIKKRLRTILPTTMSTQLQMISSTTSEKQVEKDEAIMQHALYRIRECNFMPEHIRNSLIDFIVDDLHLGKVRPKIADLLCNTVLENGDNVFVMRNEEDSNSKKQYLTFSDSAGSDCDSRSEAVAKVLNVIRNDADPNISDLLKGWRDELYPISNSFYNSPVFVMERVAVQLLGVLEYGVHVNGLTQTGDIDDNKSSKELKMWIGRRSATKSKFPGMLDHIVAGGQPAGLSLMDNVIKECYEEAGIPESITRQPGVVTPVGAISYECYVPNKDSISRCVLFNYDLVLPNSFTPQPVDGEVQEFFLWTIDEILQSLNPDYHDPIKPNCYVVIIDYLLRKGHLSPEAKGYLDVLSELRSGDCS